MEDKGGVGITRKESVRALSDLLHEKHVLSLFEGGNILRTDAFWTTSNANYLWNLHSGFLTRTIGS